MVRGISLLEDSFIRVIYAFMAKDVCGKGEWKRIGWFLSVKLAATMGNRDGTLRGASTC